MNKTKWAKIESRFERTFIALLKSESSKINTIDDDYLRHYASRTALTIKAMGTEIKQHSITGDLAELIDGSIVEGLPSNCPVLLNNFYIVFKKAHKGIKALWGFNYENQLFICGERDNKGFISAFYPIDFKNQKFSFGLDDLYNERVTTDTEQGLYFVRFLLTLGLLLEAEQTPIEIKKEVQRCSPSVYGSKINKLEYKIKLKQDFLDKLKEYDVVKVRGFLRQQACGKNWSERKTIYIAPFERQQKVLKQAP